MPKYLPQAGVYMTFINSTLKANTNHVMSEFTPNWTLKLLILTLIFFLTPSMVLANDKFDTKASPSSKASTPICQKIVTLTPELTEITAAIVPQEYLVGTDLYSNYPAFTQKLPKVADYYTIYREKILQLKYDCIFAGPDFNTLALKTTAVKLPGHLYTFSLRSSDNLLATIDQIAKLTGFSVAPATQKLKDSIKKALLNPHIQQDLPHVASAIQSRQEIPPTTESQTIDKQTTNSNDSGKLPKIAILIWERPLTVVGQGNHLHEFIKLCGGANAFGDLSGFPSISLEQLHTRQVDLILNLSETPKTASHIKLTPTNIKEVSFSNPDLLMRLTPRAITIGLPELCTLLEQHKQ